MALSIAAILLTFNEERNLRAALASVAGWASEILVVDSLSTDRTVDVALSVAGVRVFQHAFVDYGSQWNWALENLPIDGRWVLRLDADERVTPEFKAELAGRLAAGEDVSAYVVDRRLVFMGRWLRWGGYYPNGDIRLWKRGLGRMESRSVNEHFLTCGPVAHLKSPIDHIDEKDLTHWLDRHNRYSSLEARELLKGNITGDVRPSLLGSPAERRMALRRLYYRLPLRPLAYFVYRYVLRLGFLDGTPGLRYTLLHASFLHWIDLKIAEARRCGQLPDVIWPPRGTRDPRAEVA